MRIAIAGFLIPYVFVLQPAMLLEGPVQQLLTSGLTLIAGMVALAAGLAGYLVLRTTLLERVLLIAGALALVYPAILVSAAGLAAVVTVVAIQVSRRQLQRSRGRAEQPDEGESEDADLKTEHKPVQDQR